MKQLHTILMGSAAMGLVALATNPASAAEVKKSFKFSGQMNKAITFTNDGDSTYRDFADPENSKSRIRWIAEAKGPDYTIGGIVELGHWSNNGSRQSQTNNINGSSDGGTLQHRRLAVYVKSKQFGTINLGKYQTVSDGAAEADLSGTALSSFNGQYAGSGSVNSEADSGYRFIPDGSDGIVNDTAYPANSVTLMESMNAFDGRSRKDGIRYHSPRYMGFQVGIGTSEGGETDAAINYSSKVSGFKVLGRVAAWNMESISTGTDGGFAGSISALHSSGISLTGSYGQQEMDSGARNDPDNLWLRVGYQFKALGAGKTYLSVNWQQTNDQGAQGREVDVYGGNIVQKLNAYGTEFYAGYANYELDTNTQVSYDDISQGWVGMRVKF